VRSSKDDREKQGGRQREEEKEVRSREDGREKKRGQ
jgi:hypothetical protein